jgi:hypothetical protein
MFSRTWTLFRRCPWKNAISSEWRLRLSGDSPISITSPLPVISDGGELANSQDTELLPQ